MDTQERTQRPGLPDHRQALPNPAALVVAALLDPVALVVAVLPGQGPAAVGSRSTVDPESEMTEH